MKFNISVSILSFLVCFLFQGEAFAHRDSHIDNLAECKWNQKAYEKENLEVQCNDLYHLYKPHDYPKMKKLSSFKLGAFNMFKLGSGDSRFKDLALTAKLLKKYDLIAVTELQHSLSEEFKSNQNLAKAKDLDFKTYYHKPWYLRVLEELRKSNASWSLILSPAAQSDVEELSGFYFRSDRVQPQNSGYCKSYNRSLREKNTLRFAGSFQGTTFGRPPETPYLNKSYGCFLKIKESENSIFRIPFLTRFKVGTGFDFDYLTYHARFQEPISVGDSCGYECLEQINSFYDKEFHKEGAFLNVVEKNSLRFLKNHLDALSLKRSSEFVLSEYHSPIIKFKHSKPRVYENLISIKKFLDESIEATALKIWKDSFQKDFGEKEFKTIIKTLMDFTKSPQSFQKREVLEEKKKFLEQVFKSPPFSEVRKRSKVWISPEKVSRFYEVSLILKEMESVADLEGDKDVLLGGDLNLEDSSNEYYWGHLSKNYKYSSVAIGSPTSISKLNGLSRAYDHFMFDSKDSLEECMPLEASVLDFVNDHSLWEGFEHYFVKSRGDLEEVSQSYYNKISKLHFVDSKGNATLASEFNVRRGYKSCWNDEVYKNVPLAEVWKSKFECKTLRHYLQGPERYRIYTDLISDHLPISMKCNKLRDLD